MADYTRDNLLRLMAGAGLSAEQVAQRSGLDRRTVRAILQGTHRPHARTLTQLAHGLQASVDEFFLDPSRLIYRHFDRQTNPIVQEVVESHRELFDHWSEADFDELRSRVGAGGPLAREGALAAVRDMNRKRELIERLSVVLETGQADLLGKIVDLFYEKVIVK